jgi:D-inositol-3-phosphate glycosyltransferase
VIDAYILVFAGLLFSWDRTADALVAAYSSAAEEMARAAAASGRIALRPARERVLGGLRALPGVQVAR